MCGIAGWIDDQVYMPDQQTVLDAMSRTLERRGPDDSGQYIEPGVSLLHRRLAVVDPENGHQPMTAKTAAETYTLVYNGELYNTEELRKELQTLGCAFATHSDTEVLLQAYITWGAACLKKLNGIFAFAVWEKNGRSLFAARDRMGVKPFYYYPYANGLVFGSEIKALLANPAVEPVVDSDGLNQIFLLGPGAIPGRAVYRGMEELAPGYCLKYSVKDGPQVHRWWKLHATEHTENEEESIAHVRALLTDSIRRQLVSDVPLCTLLSGGLDSSIISAVAAREYRRQGRQLHTYSVDYVDNDKDFQRNSFQPAPDSEYVGDMVQAIGSRHHNIVLGNAAQADALLDAVRARDYPGMADIDSSLLLFCRKIKPDFTVGLSGECADEIFGGYPWYHREEILFEDTFPWSRSVNLRKSILQPDVLKGDSAEYVHAEYLKTVNDTEKLPGESKKEARMREMFRLNTDWFMQTLLTRKDRMSMYSGVEMRVPFCDHRLVEYTYNLPWELKSLHGREKGILREAFSDILPERIAWRKKSPYPRTFSPAYAKRVMELFRGAMEAGSPLLEMLNFGRLRELADHPDRLSEPWYGQLMRVPQIFAYLLQIHWWMTENHVRLV
ncbi:MAG: asparagine synthase (glutamine-hydrolyzing) [Oscillospiraceae bacterium]|jgi:asparagine synthase (glutamine-hydrolysing)|nr:asparagine synthase (glutamine-hydrolyzing) [Oscillospiraceae bacterium]